MFGFQEVPQGFEGRCPQKSMHVAKMQEAQAIVVKNKKETVHGRL